MRRHPGKVVRLSARTGLGPCVRRDRPSWPPFEPPAVPPLIMHRFSVVTILLLHGLAIGQDVVEPRTNAAMAPSACVATDEIGRPIAIGTDWECEFDASGARFLPVLGSCSPVLMDLRLRAASLRRGPHEVPFAAEAAPEVRGERVAYRRAEGIVERFDATDAGLEQSLVLERPVGGEGDLVVTIAIGGNAAAHGRQTADGGLCFSQGQGGVDYGALTAIAADGARCPGDVRLVPGAIEWVVPAAFVERASYPLMLDPLVGSNFQVTVPLAGAPGSPFESDVASDLAYDVSTDTYLLVWQRRYSTGTPTPTITTSIRGQRLNGNGALVGSVLAISVVDSARSPRVANVNPSNRFAVTWVQDFFGQSQVRLRAVAADGTMSSTAFVVGEPQGSIEVCDVAGESSGALGVASRAWVVWVGASQDLMCTLVDVPSGSAPPVVGVTNVLHDDARREGPLSICSGPSAFGRLGAVAASLNGQDLVLTVCNRDCVLSTPTQTVYSNPLSGGTFAASQLASAAIDGGGNNPTDFLIAVEARVDSITTGGYSQVDLLPASSMFGQLTIGSPVTLTSFASVAGGLLASPEVAWRNGKGFVAYVSGPTGGVQLRGFDPRTCTTCEGPLQAVGATSLLQPSDPALSLGDSVTAGAATDGLLVWTSNVDSVSVTGPLLCRRFDVFAPGASVTNLGGGCGGAGTPNAVGLPNVGNGLFRLQLLFPGAQSFFAVLNVASPAPTVGCGLCQWLPFESTVVLPVTSNLVEVPLPVPCAATLSGAQIDAQWTVWRVGQAPCPLAPNFVLSDIQRLSLQ